METENNSMNRVLGERDIGETDISKEKALKIYVDMVRARRFDERALSLQRRGWMSGYPPYKGQEGSQVGAAHAMEDRDLLFPTYRSNAMLITRGVPMSDILLFRRGHSEFESDHDKRNFPQAVPIATQIPHATGAGMAMNYKREDDKAVLCYFGDGATSEGDFHEGLNFAGVFETPTVFFCENNNWAISLPRRNQTASDTIAQKAVAYGFDGVQVDGNDPLAVYETVTEGLELAREREPVLVESLTYRQGAHTTSDDPSRYRDVEGELPGWRTRDPIERYDEYLQEQGLIDEEFHDEVVERVDEELDEAVEKAESMDPSEPEDVFDHIYEDTTPQLEEEKEWLLSFIEDHDVNEVE